MMPQTQNGAVHNERSYLGLPAQTQAAGGKRPFLLCEDDSQPCDWSSLLDEVI